VVVVVVVVVVVLIVSASHIASNNEHLRRVSEVLPCCSEQAQRWRGDEAGMHEAECLTPNEW
jgi:uncharacterized membrane protein